MVKVLPEWLTERVEHAPTSYHRQLSPVAALRSRMAWQKLKRRAGESDELWAFSSPPDHWSRRARYTGYALVREGKILHSAIATRG